MADEVLSTPEGPEEDRIRDTERERLHALAEGNIELARRFHADDFQLITPIGRTLSKEQYLGDVASGEIRYFVWEPDSRIDVRLYGQVALIRYRSYMEMGVPEQKSVLRCWHTDSYEKRDGRWQVVWSQATAIR